MATEPRPRAQDLEHFRDYLRMLARLHLDRRIQTKVDPSDVVQETLIKAIEAIDEFRGIGEVQLAAWLRRILANQMVDTLRQLGRDKRNIAMERSLQVAVDESSARIDAWLAAEQTTPSAQAMREERLVRLAQALLELPEDQRTAIEIHHLKGVSLKDTGKEMDRSQAAVAGLIRRGLVRLRELIEQ